MNKIETLFFDSFDSYIKSKPIFSVYSDSWEMKIAECSLRPGDSNGNLSVIQADCDFNFVTIGDKISGFNQYPAYSTLEPQYKCGPYIVDYLLSFCGISSTYPQIAIEIDGHEWHEKTKEQATQDKRRDRDIISMGIVPIHFTGSEIYTSSIKCIEDTYKIGVSLLFDDIMSHLSFYENELNAINYGMANSKGSK